MFPYGITFVLISNKVIVYNYIRVNYTIPLRLICRVQSFYKKKKKKWCVGTYIRITRPLKTFDIIIIIIIVIVLFRIYTYCCDRRVPIWSFTSIIIVIIIPVFRENAISTFSLERSYIIGSALNVFFFFFNSIHPPETLIITRPKIISFYLFFFKRNTSSATLTGIVFVYDIVLCYSIFKLYFNTV